ncbi:MAG TPA: ABC transporter substrate-binding protein [Solirubrobacteraceae bacterium]|nr:ABC transporter substrate-binding protein [Solirubrobacteraceae bacterium]
MHFTRLIRAWRFVVPSLVLAAGVAVYAGNASASSRHSSSSVTTINLNIIPIPDLAAVYVGIKEGYFAKEKLKPNITLSPSGGPAVVPAVVSGKAQFGAPAYSDLILAVSKGFPLVAVASADAAGPTNATDYQYLVTTKKSGITSLKQLAGKTIAINSLDGLGQVEVDAALSNAGVNYKTVHYVAINFPQQAAALTSGRAAAAQMVEPFITQIDGENVGAKKLVGLDHAVAPSLPVAVFFTSKSYYTSHPSVVHRFQTVIREAQQYITAHPSVARSVIPQYTGVSGSLAAKILMPFYPTRTNTAAIQALDNDMKKYGVISKEPALSTFMRLN